MGHSPLEVGPIRCTEDNWPNNYHQMNLNQLQEGFFFTQNGSQKMRFLQLTEIIPILHSQVYMVIIKFLALFPKLSHVNLISAHKERNG